MSKNPGEGGGLRRRKGGVHKTYNDTGWYAQCYKVGRMLGGGGGDNGGDYDKVDYNILRLPPPPPRAFFAAES